MPRPPRERWLLTLEPADDGQPGPYHRLKRALKVLLRSYGLRCLRCEPAPGNPVPPLPGFDACKNEPPFA